MPFRYRVLAVQPDAFCSDGFVHKLENDVVFYSENPPHSTYTKPNITYEKYAYSYGMSLELPYRALPVVPRTGDTWEVVIQNVTTGDSLASFSDSRKVNVGRRVPSLYMFVSVANMTVLGLGIIEVSSIYTSISSNTIYVLQTRQVVLELP